MNRKRSAFEKKDKKLSLIDYSCPNKKIPHKRKCVLVGIFICYYRHAFSALFLKVYFLFYYFFENF